MGTAMVALKRSEGPFVVVPNDGAYVKDEDMATLRIEERSTHNEKILALILTDCPDLEREAAGNAALFSAAPDMLAVLQTLYDHAMSRKPFSYPAGSLIQIERVIAKAKGATA